MKNFRSVFVAKEPEKLVIKQERKVTLTFTNILMIGSLRSVRSSNQKLSKEHTILLTYTCIYYLKESIKNLSTEITINTRASITIPWLLTSFYTHPDNSGKVLFYIQLEKSDKFVTFCTDSIDNWKQWCHHLVKVTLSTDFNEKYVIERHLGQGTSARVYKVRDIHDSSVFACKKFDKSKFDSNYNATNIIKEIEILRHMRGHPHVLELIEVHETSSNVYIIVELLEGGSVFYIGKCYTEKDVIIIGKSILTVLASFEQAGIVHSDLKPANIHLKFKNIPLENNCVKVFDFGIASYSQEHKNSNKISGTVGYMAPESFTKSPHRGAEPKSDIFSLGVMLYNAISGVKLFYDQSQDRMVVLNRQAFISYKTSALIYVTPECKLKSPKTA